MTTHRRPLPTIEPQRLEPWLTVLDHIVAYIVCCVLIGVVLYLALGQVH